MRSLVQRLKICYFPQSKDINHPADRRRIYHWASKRGHQILVNDPTGADCIVFSGRADFYMASKLEGKPLILDLVDGYLSTEGSFSDLARGYLKAVSGLYSGRPMAYSKMIQQLFPQLSAVIVESAEQADLIQDPQLKIHKILDFHDEFPFLDFHFNPKGDILWEGLPYTLDSLIEIDDSLGKLCREFSIELKVITDEEFALLLGKYLKKKTIAKLRNSMESSSSFIKFVPWSTQNVVCSAKKSSMAVVPVKSNSALSTYKAENRLLILLRMGVPVLVGENLAHTRVGSYFEFDMICRSPADWEAKGRELLNNPKLAKSIVVQGQDYIKSFHSERIVLQKWDKLFEEVLDSNV